MGRRALLSACCCSVAVVSTLGRRSAFAVPRFSSSAASGFAAGGRAGAPQPRSLQELQQPWLGDARAQYARRLVAARAEEGAASQAVVAEEEKDGGLSLQALLFVCYFGIQSGMSFYMKWLLSKVKVASDLVGIPASFLVTASQQMVGFALFLVFLAGCALVGKPYKVKKLKTRGEWLLLLGLSVSFTLNIGLNLLSLSLVPLSLTMIVRACSPLSTAIMQSTIMKQKQDISLGEWGCMSVGVFCATAVVIAQSGGPSGTASFAFFFGVAMCVGSLFSGAFDFVFKGILGSNVKLNALDTTCYMALPVALLTTIIGGFAAKPVSASWAARFAPTMTDWAVFGKLWQVNPGILGWVVLSGVLAFVYNIFVTFMVVKLSPATTAFAGNFNKAATILLSLLILEGKLAAGLRGKVIIFAVLGNIAAFSLYNVLKKRRVSKA